MEYKRKCNVVKAVIISIFLVSCYSFLFQSLLFSVEPQPAGQKIQQWLLLGPAEIPGVEETLLKNETAILNFNHIRIPGLLPIEGGTAQWNKSTALKWKTLKAGDIKGNGTGIFYLATYLEPSRWIQTKLVLEKTNLKTLVYLDGKMVETQTVNDKITADLDLTNEKHLLILKALLPKGSISNFEVNTSLENKEPFKSETVAISLAPHHKVSIENVLNMIDVTNISLAPDGKLAAISLRQVDKETGNAQAWLEILNVSTGISVFSTLNFGDISGFQWMGGPGDFSYTVVNKEETSIYKYNLSTQTRTLILKNIKDFSNYCWAPDSSFMVYFESKTKEKGDYNYIEEIADRGENPIIRYRVYIYFPITGSVHQIGDESQNYQTVEISPDSKFILFSKNESDYKNRPYSKYIFHLFDVEKMSVKVLLEDNWVNSANWSPDSKKLVMQGGPSSFNGLGKNLKDPGMIPNDYDIQAYVYDIETQKTEAITKYFDPSIDDVSWAPTQGVIYFRATDKADQGVFSYSLKDKKFKRLDTLVNVVARIDFADNLNVAVYWGSGAEIPSKLYKLDLAAGKASLLKDYNADDYKYVKVGKVEDWNFVTPGGKTITGRIHYPEDFDKNKKYPCIVYYYGGTSPIFKDFGGRYPKDWYTANGYIVYIPQPSGTVGFGQDFSAVHVNDWGKVTSEEIIYGVKQLIDRHSFIDPKRVGAMGASYGGFLTQYLATQTDIFAAYISHAGITALSSYWGVGEWGFSYSGVATADSFPWNRKDIYVGNSPLFMADRINKPLLLLHGEIDNNVPPGESYQMFAALKILGKDVALVTFKGQQHTILEYKKRVQWMRTIIAWFDKYLKNQPEHFNNLYLPL